MKRKNVLKFMPLAALFFSHLAEEKRQRTKRKPKQLRKT